MTEERQERSAASQQLVARIAAGMSREEAIQAFLAACRRPDTLFITESWITPKLGSLRKGLCDPITTDDAEVLRGLLWQTIKFDSVLDWLTRKPESWADYQQRKAREYEAAWRKRMENGIFPWRDVEMCRLNTKLQQQSRASMPAGDDRCPKCGMELTWVFFSSPGWTWTELCGRAGWLGLCDQCRLQVYFRLTAMN